LSTSVFSDGPEAKEAVSASFISDANT